MSNEQLKQNEKSVIPANTTLFEIAWEVCNQVGGIYTVIRSKVPSVIDKWGKDNYFLIGPYFQDQADAHFDPATDFSTPVGKAVLKMQERGFDVHYGQWIVSGRPYVVLFNPFSVFDKLGEIRGKLWSKYNISLPDHDDMLNQVAAFGFQVLEFFRYLDQFKLLKEKKIAHFHEWMAGVPIPGMRRDNLDIKIVFTTHATILGRYLAMNDPQFYNHLSFYNWEEEAVNFNIKPIVEIERASAHGAHILTTVSDVTARECEHLLGRKPENILPNGLNIQRFEALHHVQVQHLEYKEKIHEFVMGHFFQSYSFDLDKTLYFFTSGRYEFQNKGFDLTLEALARLNYKMQVAQSDTTIVAFFITKKPYKSINSEVLSSKALMEEIGNVCEEIKDQIGKRLYREVTANKGKYEFPELKNLVDDYYKLRLRRNVQTWKTHQLPKIVSHNLIDDANDEILNTLRTSRLINNEYDKVKVVYHPDFISSSNPLFKMDYPQFVRGCHLGLFPSLYEPWGYTPLECLASGLPAATSDLSGFGDYVSKNIPEHEDYGTYIVNRSSANFHDAAESLANKMFEFVQLDRRTRIAMRYQSENMAQMFDWSVLGKYYDDAYNEVIKK